MASISWKTQHFLTASLRAITARVLLSYLSLFSRTFCLSLYVTRLGWDMTRLSGENYIFNFIFFVFIGLDLSAVLWKWMRSIRYLHWLWRKVHLCTLKGLYCTPFLYLIVGLQTVVWIYVAKNSNNHFYNFTWPFSNLCLSIVWMFLLLCMKGIHMSVRVCLGVCVYAVFCIYICKK